VRLVIFAIEHDRDLVGAPDRKLIGDHALKPRAAGRRAIEDAGLADLKLADRQPVAIAAALGFGER